MSLPFVVVVVIGISVRAVVTVVQDKKCVADVCKTVVITGCISIPRFKPDIIAVFVSFIVGVGFVCVVIGTGIEVMVLTVILGVGIVVIVVIIVVGIFLFVVVIIISCCSGEHD